MERTATVSTYIGTLASVTTAPPRPCTARPATMTPIPGALAQIALPAANTVIDITSPARRPQRRATAEVEELPTIDATAYAIVAHA